MLAAFGRAGLLLLSLLLAACGEPRQFHAADLSAADWGRDFRLVDHLGKTRTLADFRGKAVVMFFGYTQCPDVCPTTLTTMREVMAQLGPQATRVQMLFVTVDPERDTAELLAQYVPTFHASFLGLRADPTETAAIAKEFKVFYVRQPGATPTSYTVDHTAGSYVFDPRGKLRLYVKHGAAPGHIAEDLRRLLDEG